MNHLRLVALVALVIVGAMLRLANIRVPLFGIEGGANFAPIGAIAIFCGLTFRNRWLAFGLPLLATFAVDLTLGLQNGDVGRYVFNSGMRFVYAAWVLYVCCGRGVRLVSSKANSIPSPSARTVARIFALLGGALAGSVLFFVVTNFGFWVTGTFYAKTWNGLVDCFVAAVPFFRTTVQSDVLYLFGLVAAHGVLKAWTAGTERESAVLYAD